MRVAVRDRPRRFSPVLLLVVTALVAGACSSFGTPALEAPDEIVAGKELVYGALAEGNTATADLLLQGTWDLPRFEPVPLAEPLTWTENPYGERYWEFIYSSLRPLGHLVAAYAETRDPRYADRLGELIRSFADDGVGLPETSDPHATAFRVMVLVNGYAKLRQWDLLDRDTEQAILAVLSHDGAFLAEEANFEGGYNHGFTEAAALLLLAETFPSAPVEWGDLARTRLASLIESTVDPDGVEIENSPFYHFYVLEFVADIESWAHRHGVELPADFERRADGMTKFATHIVQPNGRVPMLGASIDLSIYGRYERSLEELGAEHPELAYILSAGADGKEPPAGALLFPSSGFAILRSGFGPALDFRRQTQVIFDVGPYRTDHSHLDALAVNVYAAAATVVPDSGLFTYEPGPDFDYFHGTAAHNTVVVDRGDQREGTAEAGATITGDGWAYQSGRHGLYEGVDHRRAVVLLDRNLILVADILESDVERRYAQLWHLHPDVDVELDGTQAVATLDRRPILAIAQAFPAGLQVTASAGDDGPYPSWLSSVYEQKVPNPVVAYEAVTPSTTLVTLLAAGRGADGRASVSAEAADGAITARVCVATAGFVVEIADLAGSAERVDVAAEPCRESPPGE